MPSHEYTLDRRCCRIPHRIAEQERLSSATYGQVYERKVPLGARLPKTYQKAQAELHLLEDRLQRLQSEYRVPAKGLTKAGVRKMIARLHEELAVYEGSHEVDLSQPSTTP